MIDKKYREKKMRRELKAALTTLRKWARRRESALYPDGRIAIKNLAAWLESVAWLEALDEDRTKGK